MKPWLVAHRGASQEAQENTMAAFKAARNYAVGYLEFDVRVTKDNIAIIHHDPTIAGKIIADSSFDELLAVDPQLAQFEEVVAEHHELPLFVELKSDGSAEHALDYLQANQESYATSFLEHELIFLQNQGIADNRLFLAQYNHPIGLLRRARTRRFGGITLNKWYLTPLYNLRARKAGIAIMIYVVNNRWWAWLVRRCFSNVFICTDRPDKLERLR